MPTIQYADVAVEKVRWEVAEPLAAEPSPPPSPQANPADPASVARGLTEWLSERYPKARIRFLQPPASVQDGWDTYLYFFELAPDPGLPDLFLGPLALRLYSARTERATREFDYLRRVHRLEFAAPDPVAWEPRPHALGGSFVVMRRIVGPTFLEYMLAWFPRLWQMSEPMAKRHAELHSLPVGELADAGETFLDRNLSAMRRVIEQCRLDGLVAGLEWLEQHRPPVGTPCLLHFDFHPLNLLVDGETKELFVIDWNTADVGDRHADVGWTDMQLTCGPVEDAPLWKRPFVLIGRAILRKRYHKAYRRVLPLDEDRLRYYKAFAGMKELCVFGKWLVAGPSATGSRENAGRRLTQAHLDRLADYVRRHGGVQVSLRRDLLAEPND